MQHGVRKVHKLPQQTRLARHSIKVAMWLFKSANAQASLDIPPEVMNWKLYWGAFVFGRYRNWQQAMCGLY